MASITPRELSRLQQTREILLGRTMSAASAIGFLSQYIASLPQYIDDAQRDFGFDIYERMSKDYQIASNILALQMSVMSEGPRLLNRITAPSITGDDSDDAKYKKGEEIRLEMERQLAKLSTPFEEFLLEIVDFVVNGNILAEKTYDIRDGKLVLKKLAVKPPQSFRYIVNTYMDFLGVQPVGKLTGGLPAVTSQLSLSGGDFVPRSKFLHMAFRSKGGDPRGTSLLRAAYNPWFIKLNLWPAFVKFAAQFGTPSIVATLPEGIVGSEKLDDSGNIQYDLDNNPEMKSAAEIVLEKIINFQNGSAIVNEFGTEMNILEPKANGEFFDKGVAMLDRAITKAMLISTRATMEAEFGSKADSGTAKDLMDTFTKVLRRLIEVSIYRDVLYPTVVMNYGEEVAEEYCPFLSLSELPHENISDMGNMIANMARTGMIHDSQKPGIDKMLSLPARDYEAEMAEKKLEQEREDELMKMKNNVLSPSDMPTKSNTDGRGTGERDTGEKVGQKPRNPQGTNRK